MAEQFGGRWTIERSLGEGGQAHTFLVNDTLHPDGPARVLKRLKNENRIDRFRQEVEAVKALVHPNILGIVDVGLNAPPYYFVTEYCEGGSIEDADLYWRDRPDLALELFLDVCAAAAYAHSQGIIHRDIKPANVFLRTLSGPAVLGDFGICFLETTAPRITSTSEAVGPRLYMAPELEDGRLDEVTDRCDTYSLGKLLYWLLSGRVFSREKHRDKQWDLKGRNEDTPFGWDNVYLEHVNRLLDFMILENPDERRSVANIAILAKRAKRLISRQFPAISPGLPIPCEFCGQGNYVEKVSSTSQLQNFGIQPIGSADWRALVCNACGHVQFFRVEFASRKDWWGSDG